jgi:O-antigen ligase
MITNKKYEILDRIIEYGIYLYIFFMFLAKGEGIRNVIIFGNFALWLITVRKRNNLFLLKDPVMILCWIYLASIASSVVFSIDPAYSLMEFKGDPLKFGLLLPVVATVMADEKRLIKACFICFVTLMFIVLAGYYSYMFQELEMLKPNTVLVHAWHGRFGRYLCILIPYSFVLNFIWKSTRLKGILIISLIISLVALILSTSRSGYAAMLSIVFIWTVHYSITKKYSFTKIIISSAIIILFLVVVIYHYVPDVRIRLSSTSHQISTFHDRTQLWKAALFAARERPITGWGYGELIYHEDQPFADTPFGKALETDKGIHNMFITILFHQGVISLLPYVFLILTSIVLFWGEALKNGGIRKYILVTGVSILIGNYVIQAMLSNPALNYLAVVLGLSMAAKGIDFNSIYRTVE